MTPEERVVNAAMAIWKCDQLIFRGGGLGMEIPYKEALELGAACEELEKFRNESTRTTSTNQENRPTSEEK